MNALVNIIISIRPKQWIKNLLVFAAIIFSENLFDSASFLKILWTFFIFCGISGAVYIFNDIIDIKYDKNHPLKSLRPIASGKIPPINAMVIGFFIALASIILAFFLNYYLGWIISLYLCMNLAYSKFLKNQVIIDVMVIALGFVLRALAGVVVLGVYFSHWLLICTLLLALFFAFGKRRHELLLLNNHAEDHRQILAEYSANFLDQMIGVVTSATLVMYILYTTSTEVVARIDSYNLVYTTPFVLYGIFRYLYLIHQKEGGGSPTHTILADKPLLIDILFWFLSVLIIIYYL